MLFCCLNIFLADVTVPKRQQYRTATRNFHIKTIKFHLNIQERFPTFKSAGGYETGECEARGPCALFIREIRLLSLQSWPQSNHKKTLKTRYPPPVLRVRTRIH